MPSTRKKCVDCGKGAMGKRCSVCRAKAARRAQKRRLAVAKMRKDEAAKREASGTAEAMRARMAANKERDGTPDDRATRIINDAAKQSMRNDATRPPQGAAAVQTTHERELLQREKLILEAALHEEERDLSQRSFWYFVTHTLFPETWQKHYTPSFHKPICDDIQSLARGEDLFLVIPRKRRKTFLGSLAHSMWRIIRDPNIRLLMVGAREETVKKFARWLRDAFMPNSHPQFAKFHRLFPEFLLPTTGSHLRQSFQFTIPNRTLPIPDPTFLAGFLGSSFAGSRCDILILDDPIERRNVATPEMSLKSLMHIMDLFPLLDDTGDYMNIIDLTTRWAYHDPTGFLIGEAEEGVEVDDDILSRIEERKTKIIIRHALEDPDRPCEHCPKHVVAAHPHGHPSLAANAVSIDFPIHTREGVLAEMARYQANPNLGESLFWHQLMNVCMSPKRQKFKEDWFLRGNANEWPVPRLHVLAMDSASKDMQSAGEGDYFVAHWGSFDEYGRLLIRHSIRSRDWTKDECIRQMVAVCLRMGWWPHVVAKEKFGEDSFLTDVNRAFLEQARPTRMKVASRPMGLAKDDSIVEALQGPMERAEIIFAKDYPPPMLARLRFELTKLGQVVHEDMADALHLFMIPGVRYAKPDHKGDRPKQPWTAPALGSYTGDPDPPGVNSDTSDPYKQARQGKRATTAFAELVANPAQDVRWETPESPATPFGGLDLYEQ